MRDDTAGVVAILTALDLEYDAVRAQLTGWRMRQDADGTVFEECRLPGSSWSLVIACTGVGNDSAAVLTERAFRSRQAEAVLFVGIAGALAEDLRLGDVVVATKVYAYHGGKDEDSGFKVRPNAWLAPHGLEQLARYVLRTGAWTKYLPAGRIDKPPTVHFRPIAAGDVVLDSRVTALGRRLRDSYNDAAAIEMESAGAAHAGHLNDSRPVLTIRGISDRADGNKMDLDNDGWQPVAAASAAAFALGLVMEIVKNPGAFQGRPRTRAADLDEPSPTWRAEQKLEFTRRLGKSWPDLADAVGIASYERARFAAGNEAREIWEWLEARQRLVDLSRALLGIGRKDLIQVIADDAG